MKEEHRNILMIQLVYVLTGLLVALTLWLILPEDSQARINAHQWEFGGAFAGFAFVWLTLRSAGLLDQMLQSAQQTVQAGVKLKPTTHEEYNDLFDGFTNCDYRAFNPPFALEESGDQLYKEAIATHVRRYRDEGVKSRYLFFDEASYERATRFFQEVGKGIGQDRLAESVTVRLWEKPPPLPRYTFFTGYKEGKPWCIFYPSVGMQEGLPQAIIYVQGAKDFLSILEGHFQEQWSQANESG